MTVSKLPHTSDKKCHYKNNIKVFLPPADKVYIERQREPKTGGK